MSGKLSPFPLAANTQIIQFDETAIATIPKTYIQCIHQGHPTFPDSVKRVQQQGAKIITLHVDHCVMLTHPEALSKILLKI